jgi:hypothetical protein
MYTPAHVLSHRCGTLREQDGAQASSIASKEASTSGARRSSKNLGTDRAKQRFVVALRTR